jgi:hypothetical protein
MGKVWLVLLMLCIIAANMPALMAQWHADRSGVIKTLQLLAIYLTYCLIGAGVVIWLVTRARVSGSGGGAILALTGFAVGWVLYGALTLTRAVPRYRELTRLAHAIRAGRRRGARLLPGMPLGLSLYH